MTVAEAPPVAFVLSKLLLGKRMAKSPKPATAAS